MTVSISHLSSSFDQPLPAKPPSQGGTLTERLAEIGPYYLCDRLSSQNLVQSISSLTTKTESNSLSNCKMTTTTCGDSSKFLRGINKQWKFQCLRVNPRQSSKKHAGDDIYTPRPLYAQSFIYRGDRSVRPVFIQLKLKQRVKNLSLEEPKGALTSSIV